ncbi:MAG: selenocysteine-specific translation elongation factor [Planctomycetes bacterium]|nr:selenocysteine-specific translation elongation factor [Planctomycetota bacterium]
MTAAAPNTTTRACILGTAGHIDHGKSSLVKALTGTDPDRLPEEQARGMTIELGYAHLALADSKGRPLQIGIVDVPGHERFVRTMVAGATGVDLAMLVVAADDGVMPQTREHVDILNLLGLPIGLIAISKSDMVPSDRITDVKAQLDELLRGTPLAEWPRVACSAKTGTGLDDVRATIVALVDRLPSRERGPIFRLAIDRVFAVHGRGTVITGSVLSGAVTAGASLELQPAGLPCKVREVQSFGSAVTDAGAGQRAALNLTGIERERIDRGMELATPGFLTPARYVDARVRMLTRSGKPFASHQRVRVCMGTTEAMAMLVVVGGDAIPPGESTLVQFRFQTPVVCAYGQRFILRNETAQLTIGGGVLVRPSSRRFRPSHADELESLHRAESPETLVRFEEALRQAGFSPRTDIRIACEIGIAPTEVAAQRERLRQAGKLAALTGGPLVHIDTLAAVEARAAAYLKRHHAANPQEPGVLRDRFITWLDRRTTPGGGKSLLSRLEASGIAHAKGPYIAHRDFRPALSPEDAALMEQVVSEILAARLDPPLLAALKSAVGLSKQRLKVLEDLAKTEPRLVMFEPQHYISANVMADLKQCLRELGNGRRFKMAEVRDALQARVSESQSACGTGSQPVSRRVVQPLLEHLDRVGFTRRVGDERILLDTTR